MTDRRVRELYVVQLVRPDGVGRKEMAGYIEEAVSSWKGQYHPDNPLFDIDEDAVKVKTLTRKRAKLLSQTIES